MATHEHHGEFVVAQGGGRRRFLQPPVEAVELAAQRGFASEEIDGTIPRHLEEPAARLEGNAAEGPRGERSEEGILHRLLGEIEAGRAEPAREPRHHVSRAMAEEVLDERADFGRFHAALSFAGSCPRPRAPRGCPGCRDGDGSRAG